MSQEVTIIEKIDLSGASVSLRSDGIIEFFIQHNHTLQVEEAKSIVHATAQVGGGKKFPLLIRAGNYALVDTEVRKYAASPEANQYTVCSAILVSNLAQKLLGNAYIKFNKPPTPTKLFTDEQQAIQWLYASRS